MKILENINTKMLVRVGLLMALEIILTRFCSIQTPIVRIGFGFLPIAIIAVLYGPVVAGLAYAAGDFLGATLFPIGAYFPGFTLTAFLTGVVYGLFFYKRQMHFALLLCAVIIVTLVLNLCLDTLWLKMITENGYWALLPSRIIKCALMIPLQTIIIGFLWNRIKQFLQ